MADGRSEAAWRHTATLLAMLVNCHRDPKRGRPARPDDFLPRRAQRRSRAEPDDLSPLRQAMERRFGGPTDRDADAGGTS